MGLDTRYRARARNALPTTQTEWFASARRPAGRPAEPSYQFVGPPGSRSDGSEVASGRAGVPAPEAHLVIVPILRCDTLNRTRGRSVVVAQKPSKLLGRVRFPSPALRAAWGCRGYDRRSHGEWRSLVAHPAGGRAVAGSNPVSPTERPEATRADAKCVEITWQWREAVAQGAPDAAPRCRPDRPEVGWRCSR
jgi:hypothetical protein